MNRFILAFALFAVTACGAKSGIVAIGQNSYMATKQQSTGFPGLGNMKAEVLTEANSLCEKQGKVMKLTSSSETQPPYVLGNYPRVEVQFTCETAQP